MQQRTLFIAVLIITLAALPAMAMKGHDSHGSGHDMQADKQMDHGKDDKAMDHGGMGGTFKHMASEGGIDAEFQVMSLASMNMTSDKGETHHIMVNLKETEGGAAIKHAVGKIKVIAPDKTEQVSPLKNYSHLDYPWLENKIATAMNEIFSQFNNSRKDGLDVTVETAIVDVFPEPGIIKDLFPSIDDYPYIEIEMVIYETHSKAELFKLCHFQKGEAFEEVLQTFIDDLEAVFGEE